MERQKIARAHCNLLDAVATAKHAFDHLLEEANDLVAEAVGVDARADAGFAKGETGTRVGDEFLFVEENDAGDAVPERVEVTAVYPDGTYAVRVLEGLGDMGNGARPKHYHRHAGWRRTKRGPETGVAVEVPGAAQTFQAPPEVSPVWTAVTSARTSSLHRVRAGDVYEWAADGVIERATVDRVQDDGAFFLRDRTLYADRIWRRYTEESGPHKVAPDARPGWRLLSRGVEPGADTRVVPFPRVGNARRPMIGDVYGSPRTSYLPSAHERLTVLDVFPDGAYVTHREGDPLNTGTVHGPGKHADWLLVFAGTGALPPSLQKALPVIDWEGRARATAPLVQLSKDPPPGDPVPEDARIGDEYTGPDVGQGVERVGVTWVAPDGLGYEVGVVSGAPRTGYHQRGEHARAIGWRMTARGEDPTVKAFTVGATAWESALLEGAYASFHAATTDQMPTSSAFAEVARRLFHAQAYRLEAKSWLDFPLRLKASEERDVMLATAKFLEHTAQVGVPEKSAFRSALVWMFRGCPNQATAAVRP